MIRRYLSNEERAVSFLLIGAFLLRLYTLSSESLWLDEALMNFRIGNGFRSLLTDWDSHRQGPAYPILMRVWTVLFGTSEFALRLPSVVFGTLAVHALWLIVRRIADSRAAFLTALFAASNPFLIYFSQEARPYAFWLWLIALSHFFLLKCASEPSRLSKIGYVLTTIGALYSHPYGPFVILSQLILLGPLSRDALRAMRRPAVWILAAYLPMAAVFAGTFVRKISNPGIAGGWLTRPTLNMFAETTEEYFFWQPLEWTVLAIVLVGIAANRKRLRQMLFPAALLTSFVVVPWLVSQLVPVYSPRYSQPALLGVLAFAGWTVAQQKRPLQFITAGLILGFTLLPLYNLYTKLDKDPWRQTVSMLSSEFKAGNRLVVFPFYAEHPLRYYLEIDRQNIALPRTVSDLSKSLPDSGTVWFVSAKYSRTDSLDAEFRNLLSARGQQTFQESFPEKKDVNPFVFQLHPITLTRYELFVKSDR
ncbi:glycosyltransferase family 39 protein [bacterium]|nr:glycosyltransferase family 39 protein [bacterium]